MKKSLLILAILFLGLPWLAKADCTWFVDASCSSEATCKTADQASYCSASGKQPSSSSSCCCCDQTISGCCQKTNMTYPNQVTTVQSTVAGCYFNSTWANVKWYNGQAAVNNTCVVVKNGKTCNWFDRTGDGSGVTTCTAVGYLAGTSDVCIAFGLNDEGATKACCCRDVNIQNPITAPISTTIPPTITTTPPTPTTTTQPPQVTGVVRSSYLTLPNPLGPQSWTIIDLPKIIGKVINALLGIIGAIALLIFVYGGFVWMTAAGNDAKVTQGKNVLLWATIALVIIFLSWMVVAFMFQALGV